MYLRNLFVVFALFALTHLASAQYAQDIPPQTTTDSIPASPAREHPTPPVLVGYYGSLVASPVADIGTATHGGGMVGASLGGVVAHRTLRAFMFPGFDMELAAIHPLQPGQRTDGIFSFNLQPGFALKADQHVVPYLTAGYSRIFVSGNSLNFGAGVNLLPRNGSGHFVRIEARDYYTFASERQHLVTLRFAFCFTIPDV